MKPMQMGTGKFYELLKVHKSVVGKNMDVISGMATMAMAIPTILFGHGSGHFWP